MKKAFYSFSMLIFVLSACSAPMEPTPTAEPTNTPEPTPEPVYLEGKLFFDKNATGLQDEATYLPCLNQQCDAVSEMEPGLEGFKVCTELEGEAFCVSTEADGSFSINLPPRTTGILHVDISNPDGISKEDEMRWINKFNDIVIIPPYTLKGKEGWNMSEDEGLRYGDILDPDLFYQGDIAEQTLFDTDTIPLYKGIDLRIGEDNSVGLMEGMIVYPFRLEDFGLLDYKGGYDHDDSLGSAIDFVGKIEKASNDVRAYFICGETGNSPFNCTKDGHVGLDYGYKGSPMGIPLFAATDGFLTVHKDFYGGITINLIPTKEGITMEPWSYLELGDNPDNYVRTTYAHCDSVAFDNYEYVYRGQLIGFMGNTGTIFNYPHLHFDCQFGKSFVDRVSPLAPVEFTKDFYAMTVPEFIEKGFNDLSVWTDWNQPVFYPIDLELEWTP